MESDLWVMGKEPGESSDHWTAAWGAQGVPGLWEQICRSLETKATQVCRTECLRAESFTERFYTSRGSLWVLSCVLTSSRMWGNYRRSGWAHPQKDQSSQCPVLALAGQSAWLHQPGWRPSLHKVLGEATEGSFISRNSYLEREHSSRPNTFLKQDQKDQTFFQIP